MSEASSIRFVQTSAFLRDFRKVFLQSVAESPVQAPHYPLHSSFPTLRTSFFSNTHFNGDEIVFSPSFLLFFLLYTYFKDHVEEMAVVPQIVKDFHRLSTDKMMSIHFYEQISPLSQYQLNPGLDFIRFPRRTPLQNPHPDNIDIQTISNLFTSYIHDYFSTTDGSFVCFAHFGTCLSYTPQNTSRVISTAGRFLPISSYLPEPVPAPMHYPFALFIRTVFKLFSHQTE